MISIKDCSWLSLLDCELKSEYYKKLSSFVDKEYAENVVFPPKDLIFNAFNSTPFEKVKVVILGQDPYHTPNFAHGLCFSVPDKVKIPKSLLNIYKELHNDIDFTIPQSGNLSRWTTQGVLLLNATLTVRQQKPGSHQKKGWEQFTDKVISLLSEKKLNLVFLLWGNYAKEKQKLIDTNKHLVLTAAHPSPLSAYNGFLGCKHFSQTNRYLVQHGLTPVDWTLETAVPTLFSY